MSNPMMTLLAARLAAPPVSRPLQRFMLGFAVAAATLFAGGLALHSTVAQAEETAICYNCPPEWADWASQIKAIKQKTGIRVPFDDKNSGQAIAQLMAEQKEPGGRCGLPGRFVGLPGKRKGRYPAVSSSPLERHSRRHERPAGILVCDPFRHPCLFVNKDALEGKPVPRSWADLLKPEYKGMIGYLDPSSAFVGYAGAVAVNQALGGSFDNFQPALNWFRKLKANEPIVPKQTAYARVLSGEIPILIDYDFDAYRAKYKDHANVAFVIPREGTISVPYVMSLVKGAPHEATVRRCWISSYRTKARSSGPMPICARCGPRR